MYIPKLLAKTIRNLLAGRIQLNCDHTNLFHTQNRVLDIDYHYICIGTKLETGRLDKSAKI